MDRRSMTVVLGAVLLAGSLVACGNGDGAGSEEGVIEISALDELRFEPGSVTVKAGEPVTFVVTNEGENAHEFILGPEHVQMVHEDASAGGMEHGEMPVEGQIAALELQPGETEEVTVTFEEPGDMPYGCHEPGHYGGGMVGTVTVE